MWRVALAVMILMGSETQAQPFDYDDFNLRGLTAAIILVDPVDDTGKGCGLSQDTLRNTLMLPLNAYTKIRPTDFTPNPLPPTVSLSVSALRNLNVCFFVYQLEVTTMMRLTVNDHVGPRTQTVMLWRDGGFASSGASDGRYVNAQIEALGKKLATAWQKANPN